MKLIDREPTPEMIEAMHERGATMTGMFQAAYDAAPEMKQEPVGIDWPDYHYEAMGCGLEDRGIKDKYDAMRYGWDKAIERCAERIPEKLFEFPPDAQAEITKRDARIAELEQDLQTTADALGHTIAQPEEGYPGIAHDFEQAKLTITKLQDLIEEQKGTIAALNWAINGEDSTSTENLIEAHEVDYAEEGLIPLCRSLTKENVRLEDVVLFQKKAWEADFEELEKLKDQIASSESSPITEEVEDILRSKNQNLFNALMESKKRTGEQASEIARLKAVIGECKDIANKTINARWMVLSPTQTFSATDLCNAKRIAACEVARRINEALAAIKEI